MAEDDPLAAFRQASQSAEKAGPANPVDTRVDFTALTNQMSLMIQAVQALTTQISKTFPAGIGTAASAVAGAATLPANPVGFITTTLPGTTTVVKVPYYN